MYVLACLVADPFAVFDTCSETIEQCIEIATKVMVAFCQHGGASPMLWAFYRLRLFYFVQRFGSRIQAPCQASQDVLSSLRYFLHQVTRPLIGIGALGVQVADNPSYILRNG